MMKVNILSGLIEFIAKTLNFSRFRNYVITPQYILLKNYKFAL